jgi:hypothetical protein
VLVEPFFEEIPCKDACLRETIHALLYFDCTLIVSQVIELVGFGKIGREVADFHGHAFRLVHGCVEVVILQIDSAIECVLCLNEAVEMELDSDHVNSRCVIVARVVDEIAAHSDLCAVGVLLLQAIIYTDSCLRDVAFVVMWNVLMADKNDSVSTFVDSGDVLSKTSMFLLAGFSPQLLVLGVH